MLPIIKKVPHRTLTESVETGRLRHDISDSDAPWESAPPHQPGCKPLPPKGATNPGDPCHRAFSNVLPDFIVRLRRRGVLNRGHLQSVG